MPDLLAEVVRATALAADTDTVLDRVARLLTQRADWVIADRLDDPDLVTRVAAYDAAGPLRLPGGPERQRRSSAGSVGLIPSMLRTPHRLLRLDREGLERLSNSSDDTLAGQARFALGLGMQELLVVGVLARGALVAVLSLGSSTGFGGFDVQDLRDVATHVGLALDAARLLAVQREVATAMQTSLLPPVPAVAGLGLAARYSPAAQEFDVGGDWYDAFTTAAGLVVVVGDASGHDVAAAARMADLRNLLRGHAVDRLEGPAALVTRLEHTAHVLGLDATATCVVGRLRRADGGWQLAWTSAGHPPPVLLAGGRAELLETAPDLMLGVQQGSVRVDHERRLTAGDVLLLYTDGLVERRGAGMDDRLELLRRTVEDHAGEDPDELAETLLRLMSVGGTDDIALLVVRVEGVSG